MGDFSRSLYWEEDEEYSEENWQQGAMDRAYHRYLSQPDSPPSPHPPYTPTPEDDPIHSPTRGHGQHSFHRLPWRSIPAYYRQSYSDSLMYARRVGQRNSEEISEYRDQIFHLAQAALCLELESFSPMGTHSPVLLKALSSVNSRWLMRVLNTPPHVINPRPLATTLEDLQPFTDLLQTGFQPNFPFPSSVPLAGDDSTISSGSTSTSTVHRDFVSGFPVEHHDRPETRCNIP